MERKKAQELLKRHPRITYKADAVQCAGYRHHAMPLKAHSNPELKEKYRCSKDAHWKFKAIQRSYASDGTYCYIHLWCEVTSDLIEINAFETWWKRQPEYAEVVSGSEAGSE